MIAARRTCSLIRYVIKVASDLFVAWAFACRWSGASLRGSLEDGEKTGGGDSLQTFSARQGPLTFWCPHKVEVDEPGLCEK